MIKRLLYKLSVGLATFAIGLSLNSIWGTSHAISLCELNSNPSAYGGKEILFRAIVNKTPDRITAFSVCGNDNGSAVSIELDPREVKRFPLPESFMSSGSGANQFHMMDAIIVGQLNPHFGKGCYAPKYQVSNARVERVFAIRDFNNFPQAMKWAASNSY